MKDTVLKRKEGRTTVVTVLKRKERNASVLSIQGQSGGTFVVVKAHPRPCFDDENKATVGRVRADPLEQVPKSTTVGRVGVGRLQQVPLNRKSLPMQRQQKSNSTAVAVHSRAYTYAHPLDENRATNVLV